MQHGTPIESVTPGMLLVYDIVRHTAIIQLKHVRARGRTSLV